MIRSLNVVTMYSRRRGGLFEAVRRLSLSLEATGVRSEVLSIEEQLLPPRDQSWEPVIHHVMNTRWPHSIGYSKGQTGFLERTRPEIIHTHGIWRYADHVVNGYCRKFRVPYVVSPHGMLDPWALKTSAWKKRLISFLYETRHLQGSHCLRGLCEAEARNMRDLGLRKPICIIPNGVELPLITDQNRNAPPWADYVEADTRTLLYIGRIHPKKGLPNLIRAWAAMRKRGVTSDQWTLVIVGVDQRNHRAELVALSHELGIFVHDTKVRSASRGGVLFMGPLYGAEKAEAYRHAKALVLPSLSEGLPLVVLEAWSYGLPVIMTRACNLPEGFSENAAFCIEPNPESITQALELLCQASHSDLQATGARGRALVARRFTWPKVAEEIKSVYEWLVGGGAIPNCLRVN